jgi:hypothetical protein
MSNETELCARALARFIDGARVRGVEIQCAGILTGEAEPTRALQQIQTNPTAAASERTPLPAESTNEPERPANANEPERTGVRANPTPARFRRNPGAVGPDRTRAGAGKAVCDRRAVDSERTQAPLICAGFGRRRAVLRDGTAPGGGRAVRAGAGPSGRESQEGPGTAVPRPCTSRLANEPDDARRVAPHG